MTLGLKGRSADVATAGLPPSAKRVLSFGTVEGRIVIDLLPQLIAYPDRRSDFLRASERMDLYLIAVGNLGDLVVRGDLRRAALKELSSQANWSSWALRRTALRARLSRYVYHDRLTRKGRPEAGAAAERMQLLLESRTRQPLESRRPS